MRSWTPALCHWFGGLTPDGVEALTYQQFDDLVEWVEQQNEKRGD